MIRSLHTAATGMQAQQTNMDTVAHNMANVSTVGFKKSRAEFEDLLYNNIKEPGQETGLNAISPTGVQVGLGVKTGAVQKDFEQGSTQLTERDLDLQIWGKGFFQIRLPNGDIAYTRNGAFKTNSEGKVVDQNGNFLIPEVTIPKEKVDLSVNRDGEFAIISALNGAPKTVGKIDIATFINPAGLKAIGGNLFVPTNSSGPAQTGTPGTDTLGVIEQGQLESSNVNIVEEMVNMITAQRAYETNSKMIQASDQMLQMLNTLR